MKRSGKIGWGKLWVGIIVFFAIVMMLYSSFQGGGTSIFETKNELTAYFKNVNGLVKGAPVWLGGIEVGNVRSVQFVNLDEQRRIKATISVKKDVWEFITIDSKVQLGTIGLLGDKYVEVIPGTKGLAMMEPGSEIPVLEQKGLDAIAAKAPRMAGAIDSLLTNIKDITGKMASNEGTAGRIISDTMLYSNLVAALNQATDIMANIRKDQKRILEKLAATMDNTETITARLSEGEGSAGKLMADEALYDNLSSSTGHLDSILAKIERGDGSAGALINDAQLYEEVRNLVVRMNNLIADIEKNPRKYFKFSVF